MKLKYIILILILIAGCSNSSYQDCFNDCFRLHSDKEYGIMTTYNDTSCVFKNYLCMSIEQNDKYTEYYVTKHCHKECKPQKINND